MIEFDTIHIDSSDILVLDDVTIFAEQSHIIQIRDSLRFEKKSDGYVFTLDTIHKLFNSNYNKGVEMTIISMFLPHTFPPHRKTIVDMIKAHHFHTDAILSEKSKVQQITGYTDILLYPDNRNLETRVQNFERMIQQIIQSI